MKKLSIVIVAALAVGAGAALAQSSLTAGGAKVLPRSWRAIESTLKELADASRMGIATCLATLIGLTNMTLGVRPSTRSTTLT
jgi:hypothetical protein